MPARKSRNQPKVKRHHGYTVVLFILGSLLPPLAVAARFGIGSDFFINVFCTLCGYFPGHAHNFYIQNIRNNKNRGRTPKWAIRYGLIDDAYLKKKNKRSEWAGRYAERLPQSALDGQALEEGQIPEVERTDSDSTAARRSGNLWDAEEEGFYGQPTAAGSVPSTAESSGGRWHYPANFDDIEATTPTQSKSQSGKSKAKKDRWARTEDAYSDPQPKKRKKSKSRTGNRDDGSERLSDRDEPEDAVGGLYGPSRPNPMPETAQPNADEELTHQF